MNKMDKFLKWVGILLGVMSLGFFVYDFFFFQDLRPRMVAFEPTTAMDEVRTIWTGIGLILYMGCCAASLWRITNYLKRTNKVIPVYVLLVLAGLIAALFVFSDIVLLRDIGNQHKHGLSQPEWSLLYPIMIFQFLVGLSLVISHLFGFNEKNLLAEVAFDSNIFLVAQYVGLLCGFMGLSAAFLGYLFPHAWKLEVHTTSLILLLLPYGLVTLYWFAVKLKEKPRIFFDEKQQLDVGRSAFWTLVLEVLIMTGLFIANIKDLGGVTSINWLPIFLFSTLLLFSLGNLYFSQREI
jgi:uncharacterized membrane protein